MFWLRSGIKTSRFLRTFLSILVLMYFINLDGGYKSISFETLRASRGDATTGGRKLTSNPTRFPRVLNRTTVACSIFVTVYPLATCESLRNGTHEIKVITQQKHNFETTYTLRGFKVVCLQGKLCYKLYAGLQIPMDSS